MEGSAIALAGRKSKAPVRISRKVRTVTACNYTPRRLSSTEDGGALLGCGYWSGFLSHRPLLLRRWLTVALLQVGEDNGGDKFLLTVIVKLNDDMLFRARHNATESELTVLDLRPLSERGFSGHKCKNL